MSLFHEPEPFNNRPVPDPLLLLNTEPTLDPTSLIMVGSDDQCLVPDLARGSAKRPEGHQVQNSTIMYMVIQLAYLYVVANWNLS